jgi:hypothetical protein
MLPVSLHILGAYAVQKITDDYIKKVDALFKQKEKVSLCLPSREMPILQNFWLKALVQTSM